MSTSTALVPVSQDVRKQAVLLSSKGDVSGALALLAPPPTSLEETPKPDLPKPFVLGKARQEALKSAHKFLAERAVTLDEARLLTHEEQEALIEEREILDQLEALVKERKASIRSMVFNHLDLTVTDPYAPKDAKGHYLVPGAVTTPEAVVNLTREVSAGTPTISAADLERVADDETIEGIDHQDYLDATDQVRVVNEHKLALVMARKPSVIEGLREALTPGEPSASHYARRKK